MHVLKEHIPVTLKIYVLIVQLIVPFVQGLSVYRVHQGYSVKVNVLVIVLMELSA